MNLPLPPFVKKYAAPLIALLVILGCAITFLLRLSIASNLEEQIMVTQQDVRTMQRNLENSKNLAEQLARMEEITAEIQGRIIEPDDSAANTAYFYQFETDAVKIESVEQRNPEAPSKSYPWKMRNFGTTLFIIRAVGEFKDVLDFAYRIRTGNKLVRYENVSVMPADGNGENLRRITLTVEALSTLTEGDKKK
tara:strand:+ start:11805 stop:12386 length:582 start_codon:yes stop_codon:yes gene_type:complete